MSQPLIPVAELLSSGWERFTRDWKHNLELSVRFLLSSLIIFAGAFIGRNVPLAAQLALNVVVIVAAGAINLHTIITLVDFILRKEQNPSPDVKPSVEIGRALFWPFLIVVLLQGLAVLGGLFLFALPGIWLSVVFGYSVFLAVEDGARGLDALAASHALVRGRWWAVFGRSLLTGVIVGLLSSITTLLILMLISLFVGFDRIFGFAEAVSTPVIRDPLTEGIRSVLGGIINAIFIPLGVIYQAKIFKSLKNTR